ETVLVIGVNEAESQADVDGVVAAGLVGLAAFNEKRDGKDQAKRLGLCLPKGRSQTAMDRVTLLNGSNLGEGRECCEGDEGGGECRMLGGGRGRRRDDRRSPCHTGRSA